MLKNSWQERNNSCIIKIKDAKSLSPFAPGLEYSPPARGNWNIVHVGMMIPESHQIYVGAQACLRGVVMTAAEMKAMDRFSMVLIKPNNLLEGDVDKMMIDGISDIISKLPKRPRAVLVFTTCVHNFISCDLNYVYKTLRREFPDIDFADCYMNLIMRKSKQHADPKLRQQMYSLLKHCPHNPKSVNIIGNINATAESCELMKMLRRGGFEIKDIRYCKSYDEFMKMSESSYNISMSPIAVLGGETLEERLGQKHLHIPRTFACEDTQLALKTIAEALSLEMPDIEELKSRCETEFAKTKTLLGNTPIAVDGLAVPYPLILAKILLNHGLNVVSVYGDSFVPKEKEAFEWLQNNHGDLKICSVLNPVMEFLARNEASEYGGNLIAIGQKAAYYTGTKHFVNLIEGGKYWGFDGLCGILRDIRDAYLTEKDTESIIQIKGWGCNCC